MTFDPQWQDDEEMEALEQAALDDSVARLSASPDEEAMQERLNLVDLLLRNAPLVKPSAEFAERVVEAIRRRSIEPFNRYTAMGIAMGFSSFVMFSMAFLMLLFLAVFLIVLNWTRFYQGGILTVGTLSQAIRTTIEQTDSTSPVMLVITIASVPLLGAWVWLMRRLSPTKLSD